MAFGRKTVTGILFAFAAGLLVFVLIEPANAQTRKKTVKPALPRTAEIVSEANTPDPPKTTATTQVPASTGGAYRTSLQDLVALRETELNNAVAQKTKMDDLFRDGLVSKKAVDDAADGIVEARARWEDAKMRLASIDNGPAQVDEPDPYVNDTATEPTAGPTEAEHKNGIKKTAIVYPRRKAPAKRKTH